MKRFTILTLMAIYPVAFAADWPQFRGLNGSGTSDEKNLPIAFTEAEGLRWKSKLPARGVSSPVVVGNKAFVTCSGGANDDRLHVLAFDVTTGKELWHRQYAATGQTFCHPKTCMAAPTPVADSKAVYALFATADLVALDHDGNQLWYRSLTEDYPSICNQVGMASSPILAKGKLIVPMENSGDSFLAALDLESGKNLWKTPRPRESNWVTPVVREVNSQEVEVLFQNGKDMTAFDVETGKKKWSQKGGGSIPTGTVVEGGALLMPLGAGSSLLKPKDKDWVEEWKAPKLITGDTSPLYYDGRIYAANPRTGIVVSADAKTGKQIWDYKFQGKQSFSASPLGADGKVYILTEKGTLTVFKAGGTEAEDLATTEIGEECIATPAISGGALFIRTDKNLICIGKK